MEDILSVYHRPLDHKRPLVCMDEASRQVLADVIEPQGPRPGRPRREDHQYRRLGTVNLFMAFAPLLGWRYVQVTQQRTHRDWAYFIRCLCDEHFPDAERIVLVMDNLNTHCGASLYKVFEPVEAFRILSRLELHYTPKHGSWLNIAECELSALGRQCLRRRMRSARDLRREVDCWTRERNARSVTADWQFTTDEARIKLRKLYPTI